MVSKFRMFLKALKIVKLLEKEKSMQDQEKNWYSQDDERAYIEYYSEMNTKND